MPACLAKINPEENGAQFCAAILGEAELLATVALHSPY